MLQAPTLTNQNREGNWQASWRMCMLPIANRRSLSGNINSTMEKRYKTLLASRWARSSGSRLHDVRTWRTIDGFAANGNSPGAESPKQRRCDRWKDCCNGVTRARVSSTMRWRGRDEEAPRLVVASISHGLNLHCPMLLSQTNLWWSWTQASTQWATKTLDHPAMWKALILWHASTINNWGLLSQ